MIRVNEKDSLAYRIKNETLVINKTILRIIAIKRN